jgi:signal transduction histidine kinase
VCRPLLLWLVPGALIVLGSWGANHDSAGGDAPVTALLLAVPAAAAPMLAWLRGRTALLVGGAAVGGYFAAGLANGPIFLALPLALLAAAHRSRPRALLPVAVTAVVVGVAGLVVRAAAHDVARVETFWECVGLVGLSSGAAVAGWWLADRGRIREERAGRAASEERLRMAQDLHDGVGHGLAVIAMQAGVALHLLDRDPAAARASLEAIRDTSRESLQALRVELARMSGEPAPRRAAPGLADLDPLLARVRAGGLAVDRHGDPGEVAGAADHAAYAVVQEALTNVLRHARASRATVSLEASGEWLTVTVADDGVAAAAGQDGGMGIAGMRSRVEGLGGTLDAGPTGTGFRVRAQIPVGPESL